MKRKWQQEIMTMFNSRNHLTSHTSPRPLGSGVWRISPCPLGPSREVMYKGDFWESQTGLGSCLALPFAKDNFLNLPLICKIKDNVFSFKKEFLNCKTHTQSVENIYFWLSNRGRACWIVCPWASLRFQLELCLLEPQKSVVGEPRQSSVSSKATGNTSPEMVL